MGNRVSIQFVNGNDKSVVLFHHWGGIKFPQMALEYAKVLSVECQGISVSSPLSRLEPRTVMVDFIRHITKQQSRVEDSLYLGVDENDGDNSDNGHWIIDLRTLKLRGGYNDN